MKTVLLVLSLVSTQFLGAQSEIYGSWVGHMRSAKGDYVFTLDILPDKEMGFGYLKAVAAHNRNGIKEVIELSGLMYADESIYLVDKGNLDVKVAEGNGFSRLQFLLKYEGGELVLDGHWQAYHDFRRYRKGRLVLRKSQRKA